MPVQTHRRSRLSARLAITTTSLPPGNSGGSYSAFLTGKGGTPPYTWTAGGLPPALFFNPASRCHLRDPPRRRKLSRHGSPAGCVEFHGDRAVPAGGGRAAAFDCAFGATCPRARWQRLIRASSLANGGTGSYTFSLGRRGNLPDGLTLSSGGFVPGHAENSGPVFLLSGGDGFRRRNRIGRIHHHHPACAAEHHRRTGRPRPDRHPHRHCLRRHGWSASRTASAWAEACRRVRLLAAAHSQVRQPRWARSRLSITLTDSTGASVIKPFTLTVTAPPPPPALTLSASLSDGKVGVPYAGQISASGGTAPYTFAGSGLPGRPESVAVRRHQRHSRHRGQVRNHGDGDGFQGRHGEGHVRDYDRSRRP